MKPIFWATKTVFGIRVTKNTRVRRDTDEQHRHCTVGLFMFKQWAQQKMDIIRVMAPKTSPLLAAPDRGTHAGKPTAAAKIYKNNHYYLIAFTICDTLVNKFIKDNNHYCLVYRYNHKCTLNVVSNLPI